MTPASKSKSTKRKAEELEYKELKFESRASAHIESIEKIRECVLTIIRTRPFTQEQEKTLLSRRLFNLVLTQGWNFSVPQGVNELQAGLYIPLKDIRVIEALLANGCKPNSDDFDVTLKQGNFYAAYSLKESGGFSLTGQQKHAFDVLNVTKLKEYLAENQKLGVEKKEWPKAMNRFLYFQKASIECIALFAKSIPEGHQLIAHCLNSLSNLNDSEKMAQLRENLQNVLDPYREDNFSKKTCYTRKH